MNNSPHITPIEFARTVRPALNNRGLTDAKLDQLQGYFAPYFNRPETGSRFKGIYEDEFQTQMSYLRAHMSSIHFDAHQLDLIESVMRNCF